MNRALIWKEFREQGLIVAALVILGSGVLVAAGLILPAPVSDGYGDMKLTLEPRKLAVVLLILASGVVVGGTLFAGEREQGTFTYLELLPVARWRTWLGKVLAGLALVIVSASLLFAVAAAVDVVGPPERLPFWGLITLTLAVVAFGAGALGSSFTKTSLAACGLGLLASLALIFLLYPICAIGVQVYDKAANTTTVKHAEYALLGTLFGLMIVPLLLSAWIYTAPDRNRFARDFRTATGGSVDPVRRRRVARGGLFPALGLRASLWVVARQNLVLTLVLCGVTLVSGLSLLQPSVPILFIWPITTMVLGTIVGVTGWSDEQNSGAFRFWAERRMPVGRLWLAKVVYGAAVVALLMVLLALPSLIASRVAGASLVVPTMFRARLFHDRDFPIAEYLWLWPAYGFAFGHLAGMLFRKAAVGTAVGIMTGGAIVALWLPSLLSGGIHWYQLWIPPLLALATARALVWSWALDQLGQRRALLRLAGGGSAIVTAMTLGIVYRMLEIPVDANSEADIAYRATIPPFETNDAGREIRRGAVLYAQQMEELRNAGSASPLWYTGTSQISPTALDSRIRYMAQVDEVMRFGWPANRPDADAWLDSCMANGWAVILGNATRMPLGTVEDPIELNYGSQFKHVMALQFCESILLARGLQLQVKGQPEAMVESVSICLNLARNLRNKSLSNNGFYSSRIEILTHRAIERWLERLGDRPDLLRDMLRVVQTHDAICPKLGVDSNLAEQTMMRNSVEAPSQFVSQYLRQLPVRKHDTEEEDIARIENETEFVAFAWAVPWEKERLRRLVGLGNNRVYSRDELKYFRGLPGLGDYGMVTAQLQKSSASDYERLELASRRASLLLLALRVYRSERGALPNTLDALVPTYLPAVPLDPYNGQPMRYRLSQGETIQMEPPVSPMSPAMPASETVGGLVGGFAYDLQNQLTSNSGFPPGNVMQPTVPAFRMLKLPAGRGIVWSVGPDRIDDDGKRLVIPNGERTAKGDLIFLVPEPAETKR